MLRYFENEGKTYEERMADALTQIPLYTDDWTDFNAADPGITILETLMGFETLQQQRLLEVPQSVQSRLLAMVGFKRQRARGARVLVAADVVKQPITLPANHRFLLGDVAFETNKSIRIEDRRLIGVFGRKNGEEEFTEFPAILDRETDIPASIFGEKPVRGDALYLVANAIPEGGTETSFYFTLKERFNRNRPQAGDVEKFAAIRWECYCQGGWQEIKVRDMTSAFLMSGEVRMWLPEDAAIYRETPVSGYCIRAVLEHAEYDVRPRLVGVWAFLFEAWQKKTLSECISVGHGGEVEITTGIPEETYVDVFVRETRGDSYRKYEYSPQTDQKGRFYDRMDPAPGKYVLTFDKEKRGFGPLRGRDCVKVVLYTDEVMRKYRLGRVIGSDDQRIELPFSPIVAHSFSIIARRTTSEGEVLYDFVRPEKEGDGALYYHLMESDGAIEIEDAGAFIGAELFLAGVAIHNGTDGNIRAGNTLSSAEGPTGNLYINPQAATGGAFLETQEHLRRRFIEDMESTTTAVTAQDYEKLVMTTPGLCIHKARAHMDENKNLVSIVVKPGTDETFPRLPDAYKKAITARLDERRLLTTRIELVQPVYVAVSVTATVYVKLHYEDSKGIIERTIRRQIDSLDSDRSFGQVLHFDEVFHAIESLECVEYVYDLSLRPQSMHAARMEDADIVPVWNALLYPGQIGIETITFED